MVQIPENPNSTIKEIDSITYPQDFREYLSMSDIGNTCPRSMWMSFRWCSDIEIEAKGKRIFERGDIEEERIIRDLKSVGCKVFRLDEDGNEIDLVGTKEEKQEELVGFAGHSKGHPDGRVRLLIEAPKTDHLLEVKSAKEKYYNQFLKEGLRKTWPKYYDQMQRYMGEMKLKRGYFIVCNKNTEDRAAERVYFDKERYNLLLEKEQGIIMSEYIPTKPFQPSHYECRYCNHRFSCHSEFYEKFEQAQPIKRTCRTCKFVDLGEDGKWFCSAQDDKELSKQDQLNACPMYKLGIYPEED